MPAHCWVTDLFEHASFGTALLFVAPLAGVYAAVRLVLPVAPDWVLQGIGVVSLVTAVYAAGMAVVQREARRFFAYLFLSHASLVLVGLELHTPISLTGALCLWVSVVAVAGRARADAAGAGGPVRPAVAGRLPRAVRPLAGAGGVLPADRAGERRLPRDARVRRRRAAGGRGGRGEPARSGWRWSLAAALNGIAVVRAYFLLFTGGRHVSAVSLGDHPAASGSRC